jgi:uncharacterized membrane protein
MTFIAVEMRRLRPMLNGRILYVSFFLLSFFLYIQEMRRLRPMLNGRILCFLFPIIIIILSYFLYILYIYNCNRHALKNSMQFTVYFTRLTR